MLRTFGIYNATRFICARDKGMRALYDKTEKGAGVSSQDKRFTYREKLLQANREAKATLIGLAIVVAVWIVGGFGLSTLDVEIFSTPIWVIGGTVGTWIAAIAVAVWLGVRVFADFDLDDEDDSASVERGSND